MRYSLTIEILCKSCMHSISLKINSARDRKTAQHLHIVFSSSPAHTTHRFQAVSYRTGLPPALTDKFFLYVFTDFHTNTNTPDVLPCPKIPRQKVSLTFISETTSQCYQGTFCSAKTLLWHLQQCSPQNTPDYLKGARKIGKVHEPGQQINISEI